MHSTGAPRIANVSKARGTEGKQMADQTECKSTLKDRAVRYGSDSCSIIGIGIGIGIGVGRSWCCGGGVGTRVI